MRINVYAEELTTETQLVSKTVNDDEFGERTFYGVRMFLKSPEELHHSDEDDDRSAITFWFKEGDVETVSRLLTGMVYELETNYG
jgi:hypothetical protein